MSLIKKYDLNTPEGIQQVKKVLWLTSPVLAVGELFISKIFGNPTVDEQAKLAVELIKTGKKEGVDEMEISMKDKKGFELDVPIDGVEINTSLGGKGEMIVKVKYNKDNQTSLT